MSRAGFVLVEVTIAYAILALAIVSLVPVFMVAVRAGKNTEQLQVATYLSQELLEEVRLRKWDETVTSAVPHTAAPSALGRDTGESATDKTTYDDIDDFNGWSESPPVDPIMRSLANFNGYTRTVTVAYVTSSMAASAATTDYKRITVCTKTAKISPSCLVTLVTNR